MPPKKFAVIGLDTRRPTAPSTFLRRKHEIPLPPTIPPGKSNEENGKINFNFHQRSPAAEMAKSTYSKNGQIPYSPAHRP